tara:strand:- start:44 stop:736 length:693 start_codon:yes stop_codon:yes gene_type:complete
MQKQDFIVALASLTTGFTPVVDSFFSQEDYISLDLSVNNEDLKKVDASSASALGNYINGHLKKESGKVAYGGYNEKRDIYTRSSYFNQNSPETQRNIHLGIDIWCPAGTAVLAPISAKLHSYKDNKNYGDYGPCIILKHSIKDLNFYTLYGHLTRESLEGLKVGQLFKAGETIAHLGEPFENGDYAPHLHFQIIKDLQGNEGDYPGVSNTSHLPFYLKNCPDPNLLLKIF